jgi:rfaE bifunctional protein nucleotidyltransferase chain/domain
MTMNILAQIEQKLMTPQSFEKWDRCEKTVVFTNGCFDVLHVGHATYLAQARQLGDFLMVGMNSDSSVKRLKGDTRPINPQEARAQLLASLFFVDAVIVFEEDTPLELIRQIKPDILVKGADYDLENIVGGKEVLAYGGKVMTIPLVPGFSSSKIIESCDFKH